MAPAIFNGCKNKLFTDITKLHYSNMTLLLTDQPTKNTTYIRMVNVSDAIFYCLPTTIARGRTNNINVSIFNELRLLDKFIIIGFGIKWQAASWDFLSTLYVSSTRSLALPLKFSRCHYVDSGCGFIFLVIGLLNAHLFGVCAMLDAFSFNHRLF